MGSHMLQHIRRRLNRPLANLVHADCMPTIVTCHKDVARYVSSLFVHALSLRSIGGQCREHWNSITGLVVGRSKVRSEWPGP